MPPVSTDNHLCFITSVTNSRLPVFRTAKMRDICCRAFDEARQSAGFKIFAYVLMPDHYHVIADGNLKPSVILRYLNGISARRVIDHLKEQGLTSSLDKLKKEEKKNEYRYSLWEHHSNTFFITNESTLLQKAHYIHQNPLADGFVETADDYAHSSFRQWKGRPLEVEPLVVDIKDLSWRRSLR